MITIKDLNEAQAYAEGIRETIFAACVANGNPNGDAEHCTCPSPLTSEDELIVTFLNTLIDERLCLSKLKAPSTNE